MKHKLVRSARIPSRASGPGAAWCWIALAGLLSVPGNLAAQQVSMRVERISWISSKEGNETGNCQVLRNELADVPSRHLVILEPGIYDCGTAPLVVPALAAVEGSGDDTVIRGHVDSPSHGVVALESATQLSRVLVHNLVDAPRHSAIAVSASAATTIPVWLIDVTARVNSEAELRYPLYTDDAQLVVKGGDYVGGKIWLRGSAGLDLFGATLEGVLADPGISALCYFFRHTSGLASEGNACP